MAGSTHANEKRVLMVYIGALIGFPLLAALAVLFAKKQKDFALIVRVCSAVIIILTAVVAGANYSEIFTADLAEIEWLKYLIAALEILMAGYIVYRGIKNKSVLLIVFSLAQLVLILAFEFVYSGEIKHAASIYIDKLSVLMIVIAGIIGGLICIYAVEYMKDYHRHHPEIKDRRNVFFAVLFVFMSAMFGLVMCNDMILMLFFWEVTSLCSFILIGYTKTDEAVKNSLLALTINVGGGLLFAAGMVIFGVYFGVIDFQSLLNLEKNSELIVIAVFLIASAGLTKSAQLPFSKWLLGAMVAPTPTSAMLHSSTMVKAGVYLIIRLAPMLGNNAAGITITAIGGITFFAAAVMAVSQSDAKKILAFSTISNLGLIVACAGINSAESLWAAIMLIVFHAIAKSLLFLSVGSTEHQLGSRNVEDMDGLYRISTALTIFLVIGIAGMFIAPFGMLVSKWAAMKAFIDSGNILIVMIVAFGSSITLFFWAKWLGKLLENAHHTHHEDYVMRIDEKVSLYTLAAMVVIVCVMHPLISGSVIIPYINSNLHIEFISPINTLDTTIIILMMCLLFILPVILIPLYKSHSVKPTSVYMSGENSGDNESFHGSMGKIRQFELRNWYLIDFLKANRFGYVSLIACAGILVAGFCVALGGMLV